MDRLGSARFEPGKPTIVFAEPNAIELGGKKELGWLCCQPDNIASSFHSFAVPLHHDHLDNVFIGTVVVVKDP